MSALKFKLILYLFVLPGFLFVNGIQNLRYSPRYERKWHSGKRQDFLAQSRYFMWKPAINPVQLQSSVKSSLIPYNFNRYALVPPAAIAPILQNYMFAMPTKINYPLYQQSLQDNKEKRKPGNLHHITIINAIMPKPYLPTPPTYAHSSTAFRNYRINNKFFHQPNLNNFARQNMENFNNVNAQLQLQKHQMVYPLNTYMLNMKKQPQPEDLTNQLSYNTLNNNATSNEYNSVNIKSRDVTTCGQKNLDDSNNSASDIMYYYCNNRITNYKNPTHYQTVPVQTTTAAPATTSTASTTTQRTSAQTARTLRASFDYFTTEKPYFLPTPNEPLEINSVSVASLTNNKSNFNYIEPYSYNRYEDLISETPKQHQTRKTLTRYEDIRRKQQQQLYTTATVYDDMKLHSFFTIEDAVTKAPEIQVFNDPYQAYRHARRHHLSNQRQKTTYIATTTTTTTTKNPRYKSFFDDLEDEDYTTSEAHHFGQPQKTLYKKPIYRNKQKYSSQNQILNQTNKPANDNSFFTEYDFDLFNAVSPTTFSATPITTYKPFDNFRDNNSTTNRNSYDFFSYKSNSMPTTTTELILRYHNVTETTTNLYPFHIRTTTIIPIITTTEKQINKIVLKLPPAIKAPTTYKYQKQRGLKKPLKNMASTTTTKATPILKKIPKYQRQYKVKKLKQFKHLFTTTSTTTSTTTTTAIPPTTIENYTKRGSSRIFPITSTTEEPTTRKMPSRIITTTDGTKTRKSSGEKKLSSTQPTNTRRKLVTHLSEKSKTTSSNNSSKKQDSRRGSKRVNKDKTVKEVSSTTPRRSEPRSRRRQTPNSTTLTPDTKRSTLNISLSTSTKATPIRTTSISTTTTMRSIMRIANSKPRSSPQTRNEFKSSIKSYNDLTDDKTAAFNRASFKSITSTGASVPPLPIEIYFKKSQNAKI